MKSVFEAVEGVIYVSQTCCWSDAHITLWWIKQIHKSWKVWVQNRVNIIRENGPPNRWFYVLTKTNLIDITTRITHTINLINNSLWWHSPQILENEQLGIPNQDIFNMAEDTKKQSDVISMTSVEGEYQ